MPTVPDEKVVLGYLDELSNAGRWGADDQRGTLNLITPSVRRAAAALVTEGISVSSEGTSFEWRRGAESIAVRTGLVGRHQANNAMVAMTMLDAVEGPLRVAPADAARSLASVTLPGRFSRSGKWIFDVAHNPDGAGVTAETLRAVDPPARAMTRTRTRVTDAMARRPVPRTLPTMPARPHPHARIRRTGRPRLLPARLPAGLRSRP